MATTPPNRMSPGALMEHRRWEDIVSMVLGLVIMVSPLFSFFGDTGGNATVTGMTALVGAAIIVLSGLEQLWLRRWEEILLFIAGIWMVIQPFVLNYGGTLRTWHIVLGGVVALLALLEIWQDRNRALEA
ncbi:hypothetical protein MesoLjLc_43780 [Mesorhizobium sp. L-8-10]|uniref:SPW repeat domain-containing protein n=1 Tax=Mesorhizobium sp. L-8-10 TaxID=2744523 RepID=UPI001927F3B8|nr:SPW repeat protein [Mesorhizobium sp. L-8-10]BCH32448.1 hypothetical protein MesoLjLc_43780 [Mesorhizobium sp. L-8-10]